MEGVPIFSIIGVVIGLSLLLLERSGRTSLLKRISARLGGEHDATGAWGDALGPYVTLSFVQRRGGRRPPRWTEIDVELPRRYPLFLNIRRHSSRDKGANARGSMVDLEIGDAMFDDAFLVEAAPADVVRRLLTPQMRRFLESFRNVELTTPPEREGIVRLALGGWTYKLDELDEALDVAVGLASGLRQAFIDAEAETPAVLGRGSPFREELDDAPARDAHARREAEVARLSWLRSAREPRRGIFPAIAVVVIGGIVIGLVTRL